MGQFRDKNVDLSSSKTGKYSYMNYFSNLSKNKVNRDC